MPKHYIGQRKPLDSSSCLRLAQQSQAGLSYLVLLLVISHLPQTMERFSTNYQDLMTQVRHELLTVNLRENENVVVRYSELPWFAGGQFSVSLLAAGDNQPFRLVRQSWDHAYDLKRFSLGVYNLDRLCLKQQLIDLSESQQQEALALINSLVQLPDTLDAKDYLVLDGIAYQLTLKTQRATKDYTWKVATAAITVFAPLLRFLTRTLPEEEVRRY